MPPAHKSRLSTFMHQYPTATSDKPSKWRLPYLNLGSTTTINSTASTNAKSNLNNMYPSRHQPQTQTMPLSPTPASLAASKKRRSLFPGRSNVIGYAVILSVLIVAIIVTAIVVAKGRSVLREENRNHKSSQSRNRALKRDIAGVDVVMRWESGATSVNGGAATSTGVLVTAIETAIVGPTVTVQ